MKKIKIFCVYHKTYRLFRSDCVEPIQVGCALNDIDLGILRDDSGENISHRNGAYCELTAQYWVWKNYLPLHPELQWIGFCHYRRFMDFWGWSNCSKISSYNYRYIDCSKFATEFFPRYTCSEIAAVIPTDVDIVLPEACKNRGIFQNQLTNFMFIWGGNGIKEVFDTILDLHPDYKEDLRFSMHSKAGYHGLTYLMKPDVFARYADWMFEVLEKIRERVQSAPWYRENGRWEGLIGELIFNTWFCHEIRKNRLRVAECNGVLLDESNDICSSKGFFGRICSRISEECACANSYLRSQSFFKF